MCVCITIYTDATRYDRHDDPNKGLSLLVVVVVLLGNEFVVAVVVAVVVAC